MSKRSEFKPMKYSNKKNNDKNKSSISITGSNINRQVRYIPDTRNIIVTKGSDGSEVININIDDIQNRLRRLRSISESSIKDLNGNNLDDFRALVRYTQLLYDTPAYKIMYDQVRQIFGNLPKNSIKPGTIAAYFGGCLIQSTFNNMPGCSVICAGSMPSPIDDSITDNQSKPIEEHISRVPEPNGVTGPTGATGSNIDITGTGPFCRYTVIWAIYDGTNYQFTTLHDMPNKEDLIIFVDTNGTFPGFSDEEKNAINRLGPGQKRVNIVRYSQDSQNYTELFGGFRSLDQIPSRVTIEQNYQETPSSKNLMIILLILLVLVAIFIGWRIIQK